MPDDITYTTWYKAYTTEATQATMTPVNISPSPEGPISGYS